MIDETAHLQPVLDALRASGSGVGFPVHDTIVPTGPSLPYVVVFTALPLAAADLTLEQTVAALTVQTSCVGERADQVRALRNRVRGCLLGRKFTIPGRVAFRVRLTESPDLYPERLETPHVLIAVDRWSLTTYPAP